MADDTLLRHIFTTTGSLSGEEGLDLSKPRRHERMRQIVAIAHAHGLPGPLTPVQFREMLEDLGPSFVKIGQILAARSEVLPKPYCDELKKLQADSAPLPFDEIMVAIDEQYGAARAATIFTAIDPDPLGSASLAQVHRGTLLGGEEVAIKVQRPGIRETMALDIDIMGSLAKGASIIMKDDPVVDFRQVVEEMWTTFLQETDFLQEAANLKEFARNNAGCAYVTCPKVYEEHSTESVLVMEYVQGIPIDHGEELRAAGYDLEEIGVKLLDNYASQILDQGFFHADPHPGNIMVRDGKIVFIDLGLMGRFSAHDRASLTNILRAVSFRDSVALEEAIMQLAVKKDDNKVDLGAFLIKLDDIVSSFGSVGIANIDMSAFLDQVLAVTRESHITLPSTITNVARGLVVMEGTVAPYLKDENIISIINRHLYETDDKKKLVEELGQEALRDLVSSGKGMVDAASYSGQALKMLTRGQLRVNTQLVGSDALFGGMSTIFTRITVALIIVGLFIGSSLLALSPLEPRMLGIPVMAFVGFAAGLVLTGWVLVDIIRKKKL